MADVYIYYNCYFNNTDTFIQDSPKLVYQGGSIANTSNYAPSIEGFKLSRCNPKSLSNIQGGEIVIAYYYKEYSLTIKYLDWDTGEEIALGGDYTVRSDSSITLSNSKYQKDIDGYEFYRIYDANDKRITSSTFVATEDCTLYYYYKSTTQASFYASDIGTTYIEMTVELNYSFTSDYYQELVFTSTEGATTNVFMRWSISDANTTSSTQIVNTNNKGVSLTPGVSYTIYCYARAKNGSYYIVNASDGSDHITVKTIAISDTDIINGCNARWRNNCYVGSGSWSSNAIGVEVKFNATYPFCDNYFKSVALMYDFAGTGGGYFTSPSTSKPDDRYVITESIKTPTSAESPSVTIYLSRSFETESGSSYSIGNGGYLRLSAYVQTINGTYIPIPAEKQFIEFAEPLPVSNKYQFYVWTKPSNVSYTAANVPEQFKAVKLLASDIRTFLHTLDICCLWLFDEKKTGIDDEDVKSGKPICASHFSAMYDAIVECLKKKTFTNLFSKVSAGDDIVAENLLNLPATINNLLNVV